MWGHFWKLWNVEIFKGPEGKFPQKKFQKFGNKVIPTATTKETVTTIENNENNNNNNKPITLRTTTLTITQSTTTKAQLELTYNFTHMVNIYGMFTIAMAT